MFSVEIFRNLKFLIYGIAMLQPLLLITTLYYNWSHSTNSKIRHWLFMLIKWCTWFLCDEGLKLRCPPRIYDTFLVLKLPDPWWLNTFSYSWHLIQILVYLINGNFYQLYYLYRYMSNESGYYFFFILPKFYTIC